MFAHSVYFWLRRDLSNEQRNAFEEQMQILTKIEPCITATYGQPTASDRPVVDKTYDFALVGIYASSEDHDAYQVHPDHQYFLKNFNTYWDKVTIYDAQ